MSTVNEKLLTAAAVFSAANIQRIPETTVNQKLLKAVAEQRADDVRLVLESTPELDLNAYEQEEGAKLLIELAAIKGDEQIVRLLLDHGALVSAAREPLTHAATGGKLEIVKLFLEFGASIDEKDEYGRSAAMLAAMEGHEGVVRYLLDLGAAADVVDKFENSLLTAAAIGGLVNIVRLLLERGFNVNEKTIGGDTLLCMRRRTRNLKWSSYYWTRAPMRTRSRTATRTC